MFATAIRATAPSMSNAVRVVTPVVTDGAKAGAQVLVSMVVIYGGLAIAGVGVYKAYQAGNAIFEAAGRGSEAILSRATAIFKRSGKDRTVIHQVHAWNEGLDHAHAQWTASVTGQSFADFLMTQARIVLPGDATT